MPDHHAPILANKDYQASSVFTAENLLREARRQKGLAQAAVPPICVLDPDGDIVRALVATRRAERDPLWACYHTDLYRFTRQGNEFGIIGCAVGAFAQAPIPVYQGATWTTDAPFQETASAIEYCRARGILAVEMEAAALYAFASARHQPVICFAHVTNQMAQIEGDFEKGAANGSEDALHLIDVVACAWL